VFPEKFFDEFPAVLAETPPLRGGSALYQIRALPEAIKQNPASKAPLIEGCSGSGRQIVKPLFEVIGQRSKSPTAHGLRRRLSASNEINR
jgi:hypothetical protein